MGEACIPTVDLSPFLREDEDGKKRAIEAITQACSEYGFFQIVNHGVSLDLVKEAMQQSKTFFDYSDEEKSKSSPSSDAPLPAGYSRQPLHSPDKNEYFLFFSPGSSFNVIPQIPPKFRDVLEEMFVQMSKMGVLLESIINECLGLPTNFLKEFNHDRSWDFLVALRYFPASNNENNGITEHEDGNIVTFVVQDGVGGLQVLKNGDWVPVVPAEGTIVVNVGDVIQVLSNNKFKSATHRVVRAEGRSRYSYVFFHNLRGDKWVEPLPQFTSDIGEPPKYRGFLYKEYQELRMRNKSHPPSRPVTSSLLACLSMKASTLPVYSTPLPKTSNFSLHLLPMASIPTLSSTLPTLSAHSLSHSNPNNHCTLPPTSLFGTRITLLRATSSSHSLPNTNCRATSATVSFSLPTPKPLSDTPEKTPKWSERGIKSYAMGELEARKLKYPNTGTEALLMGILVEGTSNAAKFLRANGITLLKVREETVGLLGKSDLFFFSPEHPPLTEPAQKALDWAIEEKLKSGEGGEINATHLLLGIWSQKESAGQQILATLGFNDEKAKELAKTIGGDV